MEPIQPHAIDFIEGSIINEYSTTRSFVEIARCLPAAAQRQPRSGICSRVPTVFLNPAMQVRYNGLRQILTNGAHARRDDALITTDASYLSNRAHSTGY